MSVDADELRPHRGARDAGRLLTDAGVRVSSVMAIGPAVACGDTGSIDAELEVLDAAAAIGAPGVLAFTGPAGRLPGARGRRALPGVARAAGAPRGRARSRVMLEPMFPMMRAYTYVHTLSPRLRARRRSRRCEGRRRHRAPVVGSEARRAVHRARGRRRHGAAHQRLERGTRRSPVHSRAVRRGRDPAPGARSRPSMPRGTRAGTRTRC